MLFHLHPMITKKFKSCSISFKCISFFMKCEPCIEFKKQDMKFYESRLKNFKTSLFNIERRDL
jgi:hypothetical protein